MRLPYGPIVFYERKPVCSPACYEGLCKCSTTPLVTTRSASTAHFAVTKGDKIYSYFEYAKSPSRAVVAVYADSNLPN
jgi:hypothetical protein